jgi:tyrosyl-tRNA synthetase
MIGDPSGKDAERNFLTEEKLRSNEKNIFSQIVNFLKHLKYLFQFSLFLEDHKLQEQF